MDNLFYEYNYILNSEPENTENSVEDGQCAPDIFTSDTLDVTDFEKHIVSHKKNLESRLKDLQATMASLKKQIEEEKILWKQQLEETAQEPLQCETLNKNVILDSCDILELKPKLNMTASEYDEKLSKYEDALLKAHAEKKANLKRQITINNYKRRLMEVENMCNMELLRVKQSVKFLQPLQMMASEWKSNANENMINDVEITGVQEKKFNNLMSESSISEEKFSLDGADQHSDDVNLVNSKINCTCKMPKVSSATQVWVDDESVGDTSNGSYRSLHKF